MNKYKVIWDLLWKIRGDKDEQNLTIDEIIEKYCEGNRMNKDTIVSFDFNPETNEVTFSTENMWCLCGGGREAIYKLKNWELNFIENRSVWMS